MERFVIDIPRVAQALVIAMHEQSATTVYEAAGQQGGMEHCIRPIAAGMKLCGGAQALYQDSLREVLRSAQ